MQYGKGIRVARAARGLSQRDLAARARLNPSYVSLIESGARTPSAAKLEALAKALDVPIHLLMLLAAEADDLKNISTENAAQLANQLLELLVEGGKLKPV